MDGLGCPCCHLEMSLCYVGPESIELEKGIARKGRHTKARTHQAKNQAQNQDQEQEQDQDAN